MTGFQGTFVISWAQTEVDGCTGAPVRALGVGSSWRWRGEALRVDGPSGLLLLDGAEGEADLRRRAARGVQKLVGAALDKAPGKLLRQPDDPFENTGFEVTDGRRSFHATLIDTGQGHPLLMFLNATPPPDTDLWVAHAQMQPSHLNRLTDQPTGVICFAAGTRIRTEIGDIAVEDIREGDRIQTRDDGPGEVLWVGHRHISGARLYAMPELRPVRLRAGALGLDRPDDDLIVSPRHRVLVRSHQARALWGEEEVLVAAQDLIDDRRIHVDHALREVTYYHLLLERHQVVWGNGLETESFHPANAALESVDPAQRAQLVDMYPELDDDPAAYGDFARRNLSRAEAAIMLHDAA